MTLRAMAICVAATWGALGAVSAGADEPKGGLKAGAATSNITPWVGTSINGGMADHRVKQVHDELHARCLVLDDGKTRLAIAVCDSCVIPLEVVRAAKERARELIGIPPENVLISATHTHSAGTACSVFQSDPDPKFVEYLGVRIADGIVRAAGNLAEAQVGWGAGKNDQQVFNRRWFMKPGAIPPGPFGPGLDKVRMNPPVGSPDLIKPSGPIDPEVPVVLVARPDGTPLSLLANYSLHYVGGVPGQTISADYYGMFSEKVKATLPGAAGQDPPFVAMMSNGTSGNINNINFRTAQPGLPAYGKIRQVADELAGEAVRVAGEIKPTGAVSLASATAELSLGVRKPSSDELARAKEIVAAAKGPIMQGLEEIYARESIKLVDYPDKVPVTIQALKIGDLAIVAIPCEVFVEIGLDLKAKSPFKPTFTIELANGYNGYLPTKEHHELGGYETWRARSSYLEVGAAEAITAKALELLEQLHAGK
jgi:neutral ceramidase